jgi:hypothetical protein
MTNIGRIDQAVLLLKDRLSRLNERGGQARSDKTGAASAGQSNALASLRQLARQGRIGEEELRRAFVRTLLIRSLGAELGESLEFQSISDQVLRIIEESDEGRDLIARAIAELDAP